MNKVIIVNMGGRALQLEEAGAAALDAWLEAARVQLAADSERDEVMVDFELALGDKCRQHLSSAKDVVTTAEVQSVLDSMGPVVAGAETIDPGIAGAQDDRRETTRGLSDSAGSKSGRARRLYRLPDESPSVGVGVCAGIAAYFNIDATMVRLAVALLTILTSGTLILFYLVAWIFMPVAETPEQRAEARGQSTTAQGMLDQARVATKPALVEMGAALRRVMCSFGRFLEAIFRVALVVTAVVWVASLWTIVFDATIFGVNPEGDTSRFALVVFSTAVVLLAAIPMAALGAVFGRWGRPSRPRKMHAGWLGVMAAVWVVAGATALAVAGVSSPDLRQVASSGYGRIDLGSRTVCVTNNAHRRADLCRKGDHVMDDADHRDDRGDDD